MAPFHILTLSLLGPCLKYFHQSLQSMLFMCQRMQQGEMYVSSVYTISIKWDLAFAEDLDVYGFTANSKIFQPIVCDILLWI